MAPNTFTEVTNQSWFSRLGGSIKGIFFGIIIFFVGFPLLFWNEGRAVKRAKTLEEGAGIVISVPSDKIDPANDQKLVHLTGDVKITETLKDPEFAVTADAIKLRRNVKMYQWIEDVEEKTKTKTGGSTETTKTYNYKKDWSDKVIDSSKFKKPEGHTNPGSMTYESTTLTVASATLGAFKMPPSLISSMSNYEKLPVAQDGVDKLPESLVFSTQVVNGGFYIGTNPQSPQIGDYQIDFEVVKPTTVSVVSKQIGSTLEPYKTKVGGTIELLSIGNVTAELMFQQAQTENKIMTWILRILGFFFMFIGIKSVLQPFRVMGDVIPFIGRLVGAGTTLISAAIAFFFAFITIGIAWIVYRPLLGIILIVLGIAAVVGVRMIAKPKQKAAAPQAPAA